MTMPQKPLPKVPPFVERKSRPPRKNGVDTRGLLSLVTMLVSLAALTSSMVGAGKLIFDVLFSDDSADRFNGIFVKVVVLGVAFLFGWGTGLASIRGFGNLVYSYIINIYAWGCLIAVSALYIKVIQKLYVQTYNAEKFWTYLIILLGGLIVLLFLHLLVEDHDLRPFAVPLLIISVMQLFFIIVRYIFTDDAKGWMVVCDFTIFSVMILISILMLLHIGIFSPLREGINSLFHPARL
ncbi:MAG: hypothetical protein Q8L87_17285 [Anaerolineales bacterium]|nr:hypothetical protein [Anaerolineales bacterium]